MKPISICLTIFLMACGGAKLSPKNAPTKSAPTKTAPINSGASNI